MGYVHSTKKYRRFYTRKKTHYITYNDYYKAFDLFTSKKGNNYDKNKGGIIFPEGGLVFYGIPHSEINHVLKTLSNSGF